MTTDRDSIRKEFASLLNTALVGVGKPVEAVYAYQPATFNGQSPVVTVSSAGTVRPSMTHVGNKATHAMYVHVFVLYSDAESAWDESQAEDRLDLIERMIAAVCVTNKVHQGYWNVLHQDEPSRAVGVELGGDEYRLEVITVLFEVFV